MQQRPPSCKRHLYLSSSFKLCMPGAHLTLHWNNGDIVPTSSSSFCFWRSSRIICSSSSSSLSLSLSEEYSSVSLRPCCRLNRQMQRWDGGGPTRTHSQPTIIPASFHLCMSAISARNLSISSFSVAICLRSICSSEISSSCSVRISFSYLEKEEKPRVRPHGVIRNSPASSTMLISSHRQQQVPGYLKDRWCQKAQLLGKHAMVSSSWSLWRDLKVALHVWQPDRNGSPIRLGMPPF